MSLCEKTLDDLTMIKGIKEKRQEWLRTTFNVYTFQDLASLNVAQIEERRKIDRLNVSQEVIKNWIDQASELANGVGKTSRPAKKQPAELPSNTMPRENGWKPIASFVVEYQIRMASEQLTERRTVAHYMEEDHTHTWPGIEGKQLCEWIINQIPQTLSRNLEPLNKQHLGELQDVKSTAIRITHLRIRQPANPTSPITSIEPGTHSQASVLHGQPFHVEIDFELVGSKAEEVADGKVRWKAETRTFSLTSHTDLQLCESGPHFFEEGRLKYTLSMPEVSLQQGFRRMWTLITPEQSSSVLPDFLDIPNFQVV